MFITLMLGNDCCIFNITINKAPGAVSHLQDGLSEPSELCWDVQRFCLPTVTQRHE